MCNQQPAILPFMCSRSNLEKKQPMIVNINDIIRTCVSVYEKNMYVGFVLCDISCFDDWLLKNSKCIKECIIQEV